MKRGLTRSEGNGTELLELTTAVWLDINSFTSECDVFGPNKDPPRPAFGMLKRDIS